MIMKTRQKAFRRNEMYSLRFETLLKVLKHGINHFKGERPKHSIENISTI